MRWGSKCLCWKFYGDLTLQSHRGKSQAESGLECFTSAFKSLGAATHLAWTRTLAGRGQVVFHRQEAREDPFCNTDLFQVWNETALSHDFGRILDYPHCFKTVPFNLGSSISLDLALCAKSFCVQMFEWWQSAGDWVPHVGTIPM